MLQTIRAKPKSVEEVIVRYPRLTAHLIAESLGYFTPRSAANAILRHIQGHSFCCEWYVHCAQSYDEQKVIEVGIKAIRLSFRNRKYHTGYMASYTQAKAITDSVKKGGPDPVLASWF
jgi:hypothetical protein